MTKQSNKNGFAQDLNRVFTLSDRTQNSTLQYFVNKAIKDIDWNTNNKLSKIQELEDQNLNDYIEHKEHGVVLDNDAILQRNRDIAWQQSQIEANGLLKKYYQEASQQLFPETHAKNEPDVKVMDALEAAYQAKQAASSQAS